MVHIVSRKILSGFETWCRIYSRRLLAMPACWRVINLFLCDCPLAWWRYVNSLRCQNLSVNKHLPKTRLLQLKRNILIDSIYNKQKKHKLESFFKCINKQVTFIYLSWDKENISRFSECILLEMGWAEKELGGNVNGRSPNLAKFRQDVSPLNN